MLYFELTDSLKMLANFWVCLHFIVPLVALITQSCIWRQSLFSNEAQLNLICDVSSKVVVNVVSFERLLFENFFV